MLQKTDFSECIPGHRIDELISDVEQGKEIDVDLLTALKTVRQAYQSLDELWLHIQENALESVMREHKALIAQLKLFGTDLNALANKEKNND